MSMNFKAFGRKQSGLMETLSTYFPGGTEGNQEIILPPSHPPSPTFRPKFGRNVNSEALVLKPTYLVHKIIAGALYCIFCLLN
jgi:hypothetical protein